MSKQHVCKYEKEIAEMGLDIKYIRKSVDEITTDVKQNTEFRNKTNGIITFVGALAGFMGGLLVWLFTKIWGEK